MATDHSKFPDGCDTESHCRTVQMEGSVICDSQQTDLVECGRSGCDLRFDHSHYPRSLLERAKRGQDREAAGSAQVPLRRDVNDVSSRGTLI